MLTDSARTRATFKSRLAGGGGLVGSWLMLDLPEVVEIMGVAGFDFVFVDLEHSAFGFDAVPRLLASAETAGISAIVRVEGHGSPHTQKALDLGADGVLVPRVETRDEARRAVADSKFAPLGRRGACPRARGARYGLTPSSEYFATENALRTTMILVESPIGFENLDDILSVEGLDAVFFGFTDLSHALGYAGQPDHPEVVRRIDDAIGRVKARGLAAGLSCYDEAEASRRLAAGVDFVTVAGAEKIFLEACRRTVAAVRGGRRAGSGARGQVL